MKANKSVTPADIEAVDTGNTGPGVDAMKQAGHQIKHVWSQELVTGDWIVTKMRRGGGAAQVAQVERIKWSRRAESVVVNRRWVYCFGGMVEILALPNDSRVDKLHDVITESIKHPWG